MAEDLIEPTAEEISECALRCGFSLDPSEVVAYRRMVLGALHSCQEIEALEPFRPPIRYSRPKGCRPPRSENPFNAWHWRAEIKGAASGPLSRIRAGVKDIICVAGIPMLISRDERGYIPDIDATVVTRLLDAGATVLGKTMASDGAGIWDITDNSPFVSVRNPRKPTHAPGGSSSGSAAALAAGDVELALGTDMGGSIRIPASWSGVVGLRPSYGLVPYTGAMGSDMTMSALGPMARDVETVARGLNVLAGPDPLDPRQHGISTPSVDYTEAIGTGARGLRIGVLREGFGHRRWEKLDLPGSEEIVDRKVRDAINTLQRAGATVETVSVPEHLDAVHVFHAMYCEGNAEMILANSVGSGFLGYYNGDLMEAYGESWRTNPDHLSPNRKSVLITARYLREHHHGRYYARSQNLRGAIHAGYQRVLSRFDVLALPTVPFRATPVPEQALPPDLNVAYAMQMIGNTCQMAITGQPAISVPCGIADELPIGLQFIGSYLDDFSVIRAADAFEKLGDWREM